MNGTGNSRREWYKRHFGHATCAIGTLRIFEFENNGNNFGWHVHNGGQQIGAEVGCEHMTIAHLKMLGERVAKRLSQATFDLPLDLLAINRLPYVMDTDDTQHLDLP